MADIPRAGERYQWDELTYTITRVSETHRWADIQVTPRTGPGWTKRQPLPLPTGSTRIRAEEAQE